MATYGTTPRSRAAAPTAPVSRGAAAARPSRAARRGAPKPAERILLIGIGLGILYVLLSVRLFYVQVVRHHEFVEVARRLREKEVFIPARRGDLLDRTGILLVRNEPSSDIILDPNSWSRNLNPKAGDTADTRRAAVIASLSQMLPGSDVAGMVARAMATPGKDGHVRTLTLAQHLDPDLGQRIQTAKLIGVGVLPSTRRIAIDGTLAPHLLGFTGRDGSGLDGLEHGLDRTLTGAKGMLAAEFDIHGRTIPGTIRTEQPVQNGRDIVLTVDSSLQHTVQEALGAAVLKHHAEAATAVVLDPRTGDVLACANFPTFDVNHRGAMPPESRVDRAVSSPYEPGSTLKIITVAAALEEKKVTPETRFTCNGSHAIGKRFIHCHLDNAFPHGHGDESLTDVIKNSCNVATAECAFRIGKPTLYKYETAFGFGQKTGSGLPGESRGLLKPCANWSDMQLANIAFGQGISVTPMQLAAAYAAIANDGIYHRPRIVWGDRNDVTQALEPDKPDEGRRVISSETARELRSMLQTVVDHGTGKNAQLNGYTAGGKTGTAQIAEHGKYGSKFVASFIGMAPMTTPQFVILVSVTDPKEGHFGAEVCAPVFKEIAEDALLARRVPHDKTMLPQNANSTPKGSLRDD
jgi:cell division protein FtsI/penicillin-binding protein 2